MDEIEITMSNWEHYQQGRKDVQRPSWFRLDNISWRSQSLDDLTASEKWVWFCFLSCAAEKNNSTFVIKVAWFTKQAGVDTKTLMKTLDYLSRDGCVTWTARTRAVIDGRTDGQTDRQATVPSPPHVIFQKVWDRWIGKLGGSQIVSWSPSRKSAAKARWTEKPDEKFWDSVLEKASLNPFYRGEVAPSNGYRRFKADIDWLLAPGTWIKILERETVTKKERKIVGHTPSGEPVYG